MCAQSAGFIPEDDDLNSATIKVTNIHPIPLTDWSTENEVTQHTRALIWQLLGGSLFPTTSGNMASWYFLELLQGNLVDVRRWSCGSAVLAYLYHTMCKVAKAQAKQIGGCLILLQIWAWERLPMVRPQGHLPLDHILDFPYAVRWACQHDWQQTNRFSLRVYRDQLDRMTEDEFEWIPYPLMNLPAHCHDANDLWAAEVPLIYTRFSEAHYPRRFCRQFNAYQDRPAPIVAGHRHHNSGSRFMVELVEE
ncbi:unnamed protein product [Cuscuta europaea]|uniref:Aminotransferase-like plant mobile domain-containing protein n=1 Tax=Cuscuta europaea TaxID=41803 RepID=A0A9P0ZDH2_CUSEU|nr:unnamed protein product [Cuscuta europaea]